MADYTLTAPTPASGSVGVASGNFVLLPTSVWIGTINFTPSDGGGGGSFTPTSVPISNGSGSATFTYTPASGGAKTISTTNDGGLVDPVSVTYTAQGFTLSGPGSGYLGVASTNFTATVSGWGAGTLTVTPSDGGVGGVFTPSSLGLTSGAPSGTFTYTPYQTGAASISITNNGGLTNPAPVAYTTSGYPTYGVSYAAGYGATAVSPAPWMSDPGNNTGVAFSSAGVASVSVTLDYGVSVTISQFAGLVGYANALADQWEYWNGAAFVALATTATNTPGAGSGSYAQFWQVWSINAGTITARLFRYSIKDTPGGSFVGQAGVTTIQGSPGADPVAGASGGTGGNSTNGTLYAGCWAEVPVVYDHTDTTIFNTFGTPGTTVGYVITGFQQLTLPVRNDLRYYFRTVWDQYWAGASKVQIGFFFKVEEDYFRSSTLTSPCLTYTTTLNGYQYRITVAKQTDLKVLVGGGVVKVTRTLDYYVGQFTLANYTLPTIGTGRTISVATCEFFNDSDLIGPLHNPYEWLRSCPSGPFLWQIGGIDLASDNDLHTGWIRSAPYYAVGSITEDSMSITVPTDNNPSQPFGTPLANAMCLAFATPDDSALACSSGTYSGKYIMSACFVITEDLATGGGPVTGGPNAQVRAGADVFDNQILFAWISGTSATGALKCSLIRNAVKGNGTTAPWESVQTIEAANASDLGVCYLASGRIYLSYDLSGAKKYRYNDGFGRDGQWSATATPSPAVSRMSAVGRGQEQAFRFRALTDSSAGNIEFSQCRDDTGALWTTAVVAVSGPAVGPWCGGAWLENSYGLLYTKFSDSHIYWQSSGNPDSWTGVGTDTGKTGRVIGMTRLSSGVLVAAVWDPTGKKTRSLRSRDLGATWEIDGSDIAAIPSLDSPCCLVSIEHSAFLIWQEADVPKFCMSVDGGVTWA